MAIFLSYLALLLSFFAFIVALSANAKVGELEAKLSPTKPPKN